MKKVIRFDSGTTVQNCRYLDSYAPPTAMRQPWQTQSWGTDYIWVGLYKTVGRAIRFLNGRFRMPYAFLRCRSCRWMLRSFWKRTVPQLLCLLPRAVYIHIQTFRRVFILIPWLTVRTIMHRKAVRYSLAGRMCSKASNWNWSAWCGDFRFAFGCRPLRWKMRKTRSRQAVWITIAFSTVCRTGLILTLLKSSVM